MYMKKILLCFINFFTLLCFIILFVSCNPTKKSSTKGDFPSIVTTNFPCYDFARAVTKDSNIKMLIKPGMEIHSFDPSPQDIIAINNCDVFIYIGGASDKWVDDILKSINLSNKTIIKLFDSVDISTSIHHDEVSCTLPHHSKETHKHNHEIDEHIWTSPSYAKKMVLHTAKKLSEAYPVYAEKYQTNAQAYCNEIQQIINQLLQITQKSKHNFIIMGDRFPLKYFAQEFSIEYEAAYSGCSSAVEVNPQTIAHLIDIAKEKKLKTIFHIELSNQKIAKTIANECNLPITLLHSAQNVTKDDFDNGITYVNIMQGNANRLDLFL